MKQLGWAYANMTDVFIKLGDLETDWHAEKTPCEHEDGHPQDKKRKMGQIPPSQP